MKHRVFFFVALLAAVVLPWTAAAYDFAKNVSSGQTLYFNFLASNKVEVTYPSTGQYAYTDYTKPSGNLVIPSTVAYNGVTYTVSAIGERAFERCSGLTTVTIPISVKSICTSAFILCKNMTGVTMTGVVTIDDSAFYRCDRLGNVTLPASLTSIGSYAFTNCDRMTTVTIPKYVTSIGKRAFYFCDLLATVNYNAINCTSMGNSSTHAFEECPALTTLNIGQEVTRIPSYAFYGCSTLTGSIVFPDALTEIGAAAFSGCTGLTGTLTTPANVKKMGGYCFSGCTGLTEIVFQGNADYTNGGIAANIFHNCTGVTSLYYNIPFTYCFASSSLFSNCSSVTTLTIGPDVHALEKPIFDDLTALTTVHFNATACYSMESNGQYTFEHCSNLTTLTIGQGVHTIPNYAFYNCAGLTSTLDLPASLTSIGTHAFDGCSGLTGSLNLPSALHQIGSYAFRNCTGLTGTITIPASMTSIAEFTFYNCHFTSLILPETLTTIGGYAFFGCTEMQTPIIPESVTQIGMYAFNGCTNFHDTLTIPESVTKIGVSAFGGCNNLSTVAFNAVNCFSTSDAVFSGCSRLTTLVIGPHVTLIPSYLFKSCSSLTGTLAIPESVTEIGTCAFKDCSRLSGTLTLPGTMTYIGMSAFEGCSRLTDTLTIPESVTGIGPFAFRGCTGLTAVKFNAVNCSSMGLTNSAVFGDCNTLTLTIGPRVTQIPDNAFLDCGGLSNAVDIPASVTRIGDNAFKNCSGLPGVTIGNATTAIGENAFTNCSHLAYVRMNSFFPPTVGTSTFSNTPNNLRIIIPCGTHDAYTATWGSRYNFTHSSVDNYVERQEVCDSYTWPMNGVTYTETPSENPSVTLTDDRYDCEATAMLLLTVNGRRTYTRVENCGPYTWAVTGKTYNKSGVKTYKATTPGGCFIYDTLDLTIVDRWTSHDTVTSCGPYTWTVTGKTYNKSGEKYSKGTAPDGCPTYDTLTLVVASGRSSHEYVTHCGPYTWDVDGRTYNKSGVKYYKGTTPEGCTVRDTLSLTIADKWVNHEYITSCGPYTWPVNGRTYNQSGTKTYKGTAEDGCKVYDTLTLVVAQGRTSHTRIENCGPYTWSVNGKTYNKSGVKTYKGTTPEGCPIRDTLTLTIVERWTSHDTVTNSGPYTWAVNGKTYNKSGIKTYKGTAPDGCPTYDTLTLIITSKGEGDGISGITDLGDSETTVPLHNSNFEIQHLKVYPNPTTGIVHLDFNGNVDLNSTAAYNFNFQFSIFNSTIELLDLVGRRVAMFENTNTLDLSGLADGTYTLRVTLPEGVVLRKVVKK